MWRAVRQATCKFGKRDEENKEAGRERGGAIADRPRNKQKYEGNGRIGPTNPSDLAAALLGGNGFR